MYACDTPPSDSPKDSPQIITKTISQPAAVPPVQQDVLPKPVKDASQTEQPREAAVVTAPAAEQSSDSQPAGALPDPAGAIQETKTASLQGSEQYDAKGKIDPFNPLIQEEAVQSGSAKIDRPDRILTPLEKMELNQVRLVAVIMMKDRQIAMVEDATGKGYEVQVGTYIGKNQGRVSEIKENALVIKEVVTDFRGRLQERLQEIKLHKNDSED